MQTFARRLPAVAFIRIPALLIAIPFLAFFTPSGSAFKIMAVMLAVVVSFAIWGSVLGVLRRSRVQALAFAACIPALLLLVPPFREATVAEWPILLVATAVMTTVMLARWMGPTRLHLASQHPPQAQD